MAIWDPTSPRNLPPPFDPSLLVFGARGPSKHCLRSQRSPSSISLDPYRCRQSSNIRGRPFGSLRLLHSAPCGGKGAGTAYILPFLATISCPYPLFFGFLLRADPVFGRSSDLSFVRSFFEKCLGALAPDQCVVRGLCERRESFRMSGARSG